MSLKTSNRPVRARRQASRTVGLALLLGLAAAAAMAQTWEYKSFKKGGMGGQYSKDNFVVGTLTLEERAGKAFVRLDAGSMDACFRNEIPALLTRDGDALTIELQNPLAGCEAVRYVIRKDGSGGRREHRRGSEWVNGRFDHGLTAVKN